MTITAFGVEDDRLEKAAPLTLGRIGAKVGGIFSPNAARAGSRLGNKATKVLKPLTEKIKTANYKPLQFTPAGIRPTTAGMAYGTGAAGLATGAIIGGRKREGVAKSAFGVEDIRLEKADRDHRRSNAATAAGGLAGAGTVAAVSREGIREGLQAHKWAGESKAGADLNRQLAVGHDRLVHELRRKGKVGPGNVAYFPPGTLREAAKHQKTAANLRAAAGVGESSAAALAGQARKTGRIIAIRGAKGAAVGAVGAGIGSKIRGKKRET